MNDVQKGIEGYIGEYIKYAPYTIIKTALVVSHDTYGYTILLDDEQYSGILINDNIGSLSTNDTVKVVIPNNQYSNMFILCKLKG